MPAYFTAPAKDHAGEFRSKLVAGNNEIVSASEGYTDLETAAAWPKDMLRWVVDASREMVRDVIIAELTTGSQWPGERRPVRHGEPSPEEMADRIITRLTAFNAP